MRHRRGLATRPVQRIKHVVDTSATIAAAAQFNFDLVGATDTPTLANLAGVITGSKVYGLYLKVLSSSNEVANDGAVPNIYMIITKNPGGNITVPVPNLVGGNDNKRFVIHQEMTMNTNLRGDVPTVIFNGVIKIPKLYTRFAPNDTLVLSILSPQLDCAICVQCHFKEFR